MPVEKVRTQFSTRCRPTAQIVAEGAQEQYQGVKRWPDWWKGWHTGYLMGWDQAMRSKATLQNSGKVPKSE